ncbi:MAG: pyruvate, phosphate dikinase [Nitrospira sp.]|nr:pyruvate, phosphate dikinase [Nitrospira sp.]
MVATQQRIFFFGEGRAEGHGGMKSVLGGKGAGLAEMTNLGLPVPPGFTISTEVCMAYLTGGRRGLPPGLWEEVLHYMARLESAMDKRFGDEENPLLVSVRSGSAQSMPGMMDTVLNLGLNDQTVQGLIARTKNERFAYDAYRRFVAMFANVVLGVPCERFEQVLEREKAELGVEQDAELTVKDLKELIDRYQGLVRSETGREFPSDPYDQLQRSILAVLDSWMGPRAVEYRRIRQMSDRGGTAVNIVAMVFGNLGETSGTGVVFTRNPSTGVPGLYGDFLLNAQGEDVVAGIRTPQPIEKLATILPEAYRTLLTIADTLEAQYRDMLDLEFTIEDGRLYMLQARVGKRTGLAAVRIAVDLVREGRLTVRDAVMRVEPNHLSYFFFPVFDQQADAKSRFLVKGLPAGPGHASGRLALTSNTAVEMERRGERAILVRRETSPDDIHGMNAAVAFLTAKGGMTSHAAVVARQLGKVCVVGCDAIDLGADGTVRIGTTVLREGEALSVNGFDGKVYQGDMPVIESEVVQVLQGRMRPEQSETFRYYATFMEWVQAHQGMQVRANADLPDQAKLARLFGAEGIGLCRTEHMFFAADRMPIMQQMILAETKEERTCALNQLLPMQKKDFIGLYREMNGKPVTIRLLDPPLHEFLPKREALMMDIAQLELTTGNPIRLAEQRRLLARVEELHETNPMLGLRGCRLGIAYPEITRMQVQAIMEAACEVRAEGIDVAPEIMVPLVALASEMITQKVLIQTVADETMGRYEMRFPYHVGTMIELPRAAVTADQLAQAADFFSFGSNDLTQTTFGFSRDDAHTFLDRYLHRSAECVHCGRRTLDVKRLTCLHCGEAMTRPQANILSDDPFVTLDQEGVGSLIRLAVEQGRKTKPTIKLGLCGEHGGDPASVAYCHQLGLDYVSCSPYRIPIAKLAAAQAAIAARSAHQEAATDGQVPR